MTKEEYDQTEKIAVELTDWLFTKTNNTHVLLTILMRTLCLFLASCAKKGSTVNSMTKEFSKAFKQEMTDAIAFVKARKPLATCPTKQEVAAAVESDAASL